MKNTLGAGQAAKLLGVTVKTIQRWDRVGLLQPVGRTPTNRRVYTFEQIQAFRGLRASNMAEPTKIVVYCRVSSTAQKPDLINQRRVLEDFTIAKGFSNVDFVEEVGGGLNFKRPKFLGILDAVSRHEIKILVLAHKDRFVRFGFEWFERFCKMNGCEILLLNQERMSPEQEMVQDLMTIVHCFSSRLYGLRNYRKNLKQALSGEKHGP